MKNINDILVLLKDNVKLSGALKNVSITRPMNIIEADENSITWIKGKPSNFNELVENTKAKVIVCNNEIQINETLKRDKLFILSNDPKNTFINIITSLFVKQMEGSIHPTAIIDKDAFVGHNVHIGPNVVIQKCTIGDNCSIMGNNFIFSNTQIGNNVIINPGTVIGSDGFGYSKNNENILEKFPHFGGVIICDNVEIGSNTCIDRGTLGNTIIKEGVKIDNLVHIAHNVFINQNCLIIANSMIGGSTKIGKNCWIAPSCNILNGLEIGDNVMIGMNSTVTKSIPSNQSWAGSPAKPLKEFKELQIKLKNL